MLLNRFAWSACATTATLALARDIVGFNWARRLSGIAGQDMLSGLVRIAGLPTTLALAAPGFLAIPAPCRRRPVTLRPLAAFGVFHVLFPSRRASPKGMQQALIRFCVGAKIPAHGEITKFFLALAK
jgi:hypothetical protein